MHAHQHQPWITIRGASGSTAIQSEDDWLDCSPYQDIVLHVDVREITGATPQISFETSPTKDDLIFQPMVALTNMATGVTLFKVLLATNPTIPLARWVRWKIVGPASIWDATFRVFATTNPVP